MGSTLKQRTADSLVWALAGSGTTQLLNLVIGIALARLLTPGDYGIVGVLTIFTTIAGDLQSAGFTQALVNRDINARDYNAVFSFNVAASAVMYAILFAAAPLIADFFHQPCLTAVSRVVFLTFLISSLGIAHNAYMTKTMMNRELAIIGAVALVVSGTIGITLAAAHYAYWALAWQQIAYIATTNIGRYICVRRWRPRLTTHCQPILAMAPFATKILVTKIINTVSNNVLTVIFGRLYPIHAVGNYTQAFKWDTMASSLIANTVGQVAQPVLVNVAQAGDVAPSAHAGHVAPPPRAGDVAPSPLSPTAAFRKFLRFTAFLSMPLMLGLALVADEFICLTVGPAWRDCVPMLQVLCLAGAAMPLHTMYQNLAISRGRSDIFMYLNLALIAVQIAVIIACHRYGMLTMVWAYTALTILWLLPWHAATHRLTRYPLRALTADTLPFALAAAAACAAAYCAKFITTAPLPLLAIRIATAATVYYIIMRAAHAQILNDCQQYLLHRRTN